LTQEEVSERSVDQDGRIIRRIEVGHVESGRNMASTRRIRAGLARAFGTSEDELFEYLEGRLPLTEYAKLRKPRPAPRCARRRSEKSAGASHRARHHRRLRLGHGGTPGRVESPRSPPRRQAAITRYPRVGKPHRSDPPPAPSRRRPAASSGVKPQGAR
jgi:hypothetical protein